MRNESIRSDAGILKPLVHRIVELSQDPSQGAKKELWAEHQALRSPSKIPVCAYYEGIPAPQWRFMFGDEFLQCEDVFARSIEFDLRRRIWMAENVPDDHIVWRSVIVAAPAVERKGWGVPIRWEQPDDQLGARAYAPPFRNGIEVSRLTAPRIEHDDNAVQETIDQAAELTGGLLRVFARFRELGRAPFDTATEMRGMADLLADTVTDPQGVRDLMQFLTDAEIAHDKRREKNGWLNVFPHEQGRYQEVGFRVHCAYLPGDFGQRRPTLADEWAYLSAQTSAGLGPGAFAEFVYPYTSRQAELFSQRTVYFHGCECLDDKLESLAHLPNLRRFHVSPWSSVERARDRFQGSVILEVHDHPGKVFFGATEDAIRSGLRRLVDEAAGHPMDLNLSDIHSFDGRPEMLARWATLAKEEANR